MDTDVPSDEALEPHILNLLPSDGTRMPASGLQEALSRELGRAIEPRAFSEARDRLVDHGIVGSDEDGRIFLLTDLGGSAPAGHEPIAMAPPVAIASQNDGIAQSPQEAAGPNTIAQSQRPPAPPRKRRQLAALALGVLVALGALLVTRERGSQPSPPPATMAHLAPGPAAPKQTNPPVAPSPKEPAKAGPVEALPVPAVPKGADLRPKEPKASAPPVEAAPTLPEIPPAAPPAFGDLAVTARPQEADPRKQEAGARMPLPGRPPVVSGDPAPELRTPLSERPPTPSNGPAPPAASREIATAPGPDHAGGDRRHEPEKNTLPTPPSPPPPPNGIAAPLPRAKEAAVVPAPEQARGNPQRQASMPLPEPSAAVPISPTRPSAPSGQVETTARRADVVEDQRQDPATGALPATASPARQARRLASTVGDRAASAPAEDRPARPSEPDASSSREERSGDLRAGGTKPAREARASETGSPSRHKSRSLAQKRRMVAITKTKAASRPALRGSIAQGRTGQHASMKAGASRLRLRGPRRRLAFHHSPLRSKAAVRRASSHLANWHRSIGERLESRLSYPAQALACGESGTVLISFVTKRDGRVITARVARSSGWASLDGAALGSVRGAPLPPAPADAAGGRFKFRIPLVYRPVAVEGGANCPLRSALVSPWPGNALVRAPRLRQSADTVRPVSRKRPKGLAGGPNLSSEFDYPGTAERALPPKPRIVLKTRAARRPSRPNPGRPRPWPRTGRPARRTRRRD